MAAQECSARRTLLAPPSHFFLRKRRRAATCAADQDVPKHTVCTRRLSAQADSLPGQNLISDIVVALPNVRDGGALLRPGSGPGFPVAGALQSYRVAEVPAIVAWVVTVPPASTLSRLRTSMGSSL